MNIYFFKQFFIILSLFPSIVFAQEIDLIKQNWTLKNQNGQIEIINANPSDVHLSLLESQIIDNPFYGNNEEKQQWVGEQNWIYFCTFSVDSALAESNSTTIIFDGLDTYAEVYLNDSLILTADNMFIRWQVDIKVFLKSGKNSLVIFFKSPLAINQIMADSFPYALPDDRAFTRKAAYQFGWDWGPKFVTMGIWKPARIVFQEEAVICDLFIKQNSISKHIAKLEVIAEIEFPEEDTLKFSISLNDTTKIEKLLKVTKGKNEYSFPLQIHKPKLWWPNGIGEQNLYEIKIEISKENKLLDGFTVKTGLRKLEIIQEKDSLGESFKFRINGYDIFAKGVNYIPQDNFLSRVDYSDYENIINTAVESNMNMLRVWGGGIYENDEFYDLCDEKGIMVWQDFMFAGNMYPGDSAFLQSIITEVIQNVKRLRNHPSIVLWCGNNEISEAWNNWGWQKSYSWTQKDSTELWRNYLMIFEEMLPLIVNEYSPGSFYWPSSPSNGWGKEKAYLEGDVHYWGVWWGKEAFEKYNEKAGRFMSEYGFQGMPDMKTIGSFCTPEDFNLQSDAMKAHQKHPFGWENILEYLDRDYPEPKNFEQLVYLSQLMQAEGIKIAIESHRRAKPYCMGTLYWQLNDCWPVTSWSSVDYYGRWKALQYFVKEAYAKHLVSFEQKNNQLKVYFVSEDTNSLTIEFRWKVIDFKGNIISHGKGEKYIEKNSSSIIKIFEEDTLEKWNPVEDKIIITEVFNKNEKFASASKVFTNSKFFKLNNDKPEFELLKTYDGYLLTFKFTTFIKGMQMGCSEEGFFSKNYIDLLPNEKMTLLFKTKSTSLNKNNFSFIYLENFSY